MHLGSLRVLHIEKKGAKSIPAIEAFPEAFCLDSCQRRFWVIDENVLKNSKLFLPDLTLMTGKEAYRFLLRVATGLESQLVGETDIFGQIKEAWRAYELRGLSLSKELSPWIQRLFEDVKEIRSQYLQNVGGASYGSLVRKLLREKSEHISGPVLIVGAGQIAHAVAPWLVEFDLCLLNRSQANLKSLEKELALKTSRKAKIINTPEEEVQAWSDAAHVVVCIPTDKDQDFNRIKFWKEGQNKRPQGGCIVHLGVLRGQSSVWDGLDEFHSLDDLFDLQRTQGNIRSAQIERAIRACHEKALLRSMGNSITIPHGWEDLAVFA